MHTHITSRVIDIRARSRVILYQSSDMHTCSKYMMYVSYSKVSPRLVEIIYLYIYLIASYFFLFFANLNKDAKSYGGSPNPFHSPELETASAP